MSLSLSFTPPPSHLPHAQHSLTATTYSPVPPMCCLYSVLAYLHYTPSLKLVPHTTRYMVTKVTSCFLSCPAGVLTHMASPCSFPSFAQFGPLLPQRWTPTFDSTLYSFPSRTQHCSRTTYISNAPRGQRPSSQISIILRPDLDQTKLHSF